MNALNQFKNLENVTIVRIHKDVNEILIID